MLLRLVVSVWDGRGRTGWTVFHGEPAVGVGSLRSGAGRVNEALQGIIGGMDTLDHVQGNSR